MGHGSRAAAAGRDGPDRTDAPAGAAGFSGRRFGGRGRLLFSNSGDLLRQGTAVPWKDLAGTLPLPPAAQRTLSTFGGALRGDETAVCRAAELATRQLADYARQLEQKQQEEEKQITALCFSAAALIVILLI